MSVFAKLHNLGKSYMSLSKDRIEEIDLTISQAKVLSVLANNKEKMIQREVGQKAYLKAATMSRMIDSLEEKGLVERDTNPKSRRSYKIKLTKEGLIKHEQVLKIFKDAESELFNHLSSKELEQFMLLIDKMTNKEK